jgi:GNAT superfamily N-acetyltransferase
MQIRLITSLTDRHLAEAAELYLAAEWVAENEDCSFIQAAVAGSFLAAAAFTDDGRLAAMGRVLSDGVSDAYIQDVVVHPGFRGQGIGGKIVAFLVAELEKRGVDWIALVGEPGTENFYSRLGFEEKKGFTLWKWNNSEKEMNI